jgi:5-methylcytosine-specific restriction endonuclease McrA
VISRPEFRTCRTCGETKPLSSFTYCRTCTWKRSYKCHSCTNAYNRERHKDPEIGERQRAYMRNKAAKRRGEFPIHWVSEDRVRKAGGAVKEHVYALIVLERDDGVCGICGEDVDPFSFEVDHIVAIKDGGEHSYANVQLAHATCNRKKACAKAAV